MEVDFQIYLDDALKCVKKEERMAKTEGLKGSITVEASYICTAVILILILILYAGFFCHDRAAAQSDALYAARLTVRNSLKWLNMDQRTLSRSEEYSHTISDRWDTAYNSRRQKIISECRTLIQDKMLICEIDDFSVDCSYNYILNQLQCKVAVCGYVKLPLKIFGVGRFEFTETGKITESDAIKVIWLKNGLKSGLPAQTAY